MPFPHNASDFPTLGPSFPSSTRNRAAIARNAPAPGRNASKPAMPEFKITKTKRKKLNTGAAPASSNISVGSSSSSSSSAVRGPFDPLPMPSACPAGSIASRNKLLISDIKSTFESPEDMSIFRTKSGEFQKGEINGTEYLLVFEKLVQAQLRPHEAESMLMTLISYDLLPHFLSCSS
jgi:hypothetical protein